MEEGVEFMMVNESREAAVVSTASATAVAANNGVQPTQLVALQTEDGAQQLAVPVIDPVTGQETYMIIDSSSIEGGDSHLFIVADSAETPVVTENDQEQSYQIISGGNVATSTTAAGANQVVLLASSAGKTQVNGHQSVVYVTADTSSTNGHRVNVATVPELEQRSTTPPVPGSGASLESSAGQVLHQIVVDQITDDVDENWEGTPGIYSGQTAATAASDFLLDKKGQRVESSKGGAKQSRKQNLSEFRPPPGLTGDLIKDTDIVDTKVEKLAKLVEMSSMEKEKLRLSLITNGLDYADNWLRTKGIQPDGIPKRGRGSRGGRGTRSQRGQERGRGRGRGRGRKPSTNSKNGIIRCDQCGHMFPSEVEEKVLRDHITTFHMTKSSPPKEGLSSRVPALEPHTTEVDPIEEVLPKKNYNYECSKCKETFTQIATLLDHQEKVHNENLSGQEDEIVKSPQREPPSVEDKIDADSPSSGKTPAASPVKQPTPAKGNSTPTAIAKPPVERRPEEISETIKKIANDWDDDEDEDEEQEEQTSDQNKQSSDVGKDIQTTIVNNSKSSSDHKEDSASRNHSNSSKAETIEDISREVQGIRAGILANRGLEADTTEDEEARIVADVDSILKDTDRLVANMSSIVKPATMSTGRGRGRGRGLRGGGGVKRPRGGKAASNRVQSSPPRSPSPPPVPEKRKPTVQCEECYECFDDDEKLAWHALNDH